MQDEPFENAIEQRLSKLMDERLQQQEETLLRIQRILSTFMIASIINTLANPKISSDLFNQISFSASEALTKAELSYDPLTIGTDFYKQSLNLLGKAGVKTLKRL